jgi:LPS sulfotransferase NodH
MDDPSPLRSYLVCATPRSGSTLLCQGLASTGVAGRPDEYFEQLAATGLPRRPREYFAGRRDPEVLRLLPPDAAAGEPDPGWSPDDYDRHLAAALRAGTTANGVFGAKLMWGYLADFLALMRGIARFAGKDEEALLDVAFPRLRYVFVSRNDKVRQAVSLWRALQTLRWREEGGEAMPEEQLVYSFAAVDHLLDQLRRHEDAWRGWFLRTGRRPLTLSYEDIAGDLDRSVRRVLDDLGVALPPGQYVDPGPMRRQADEVSERWVQTYLEDASRRG